MNNFAISSGGIGDALQRSAAALMEANNTIDESIALIVAANNVIQDPETVGTMWKTVSMRIRGAKADLEAAGLETDYMASSTSKLREQIQALTNVDGTGGFDIMLDEDTFKSTYDIMLGIGEVWDNISDIDQSALLELLAGKRQGNALAATLANLDDLKAALIASENAAGSAIQEQLVWMDSLEAKINQFKAAFESLADSTFETGFLGGIIDSGTAVINFLNSIIELFGGIGNSILFITSIIGVLNFSHTIVMFDKLFVMIEKIPNVFKGAKQQITNFINALKSLVNVGSQANNVISQTSGELTAASAGAQLATAGILAAIVAITIIITLYSKWKQKQAEQRKEMIESADAAQEEAKNIRELYKAYNEANDAYESNKGSKENLESATDSLLKALGYEQKAIDDLKKGYGELGDKIDEVTRKALQERANTILSGYEAAREEALIAAGDSTSFFHGSNIVVKTSGENRKYAEVLSNAGFLEDELPSFEAVLQTGIDDYGTYEDLLEGYNNLLAMKKTLEDGIGTLYSASDLAASDVYTDIISKINAVGDEIEFVLSNEDEYNDIMSSFIYDDYVDENGIPETKAEYDALRQSMLDTAIANGTYLGSQEQINDSIDRTLAGMSELANYVDNTKRAELNSVYSMSDEVQGVDWHLAERRLENFRNYIDNLSDEDFEIVYDLVVRANVDSLSEVQTALEAMDIEQNVSPEQLGNYQELFNNYEQILNQAKILGIDLNREIYGNIDTSNRQVLEWTEDNLALYEDALASFGNTADEMRGSYSTIFGMSNRFNGVEIAFSPMLQTENGAVLLDKKTVNDYIYNLIEAAGEDWDAEDLLHLDAQGLEQDGILIKNLIADIGETAITTGKAMHFTGDLGAVAGAFGALQSAADAAGVSVEALMYYFENATQSYEIQASKMRESLENLWDSEDFSDVKDSIQEMANSLTGITADNITELVEESVDLREILDQDGMSAQFLANVLQLVAEGKDGFSLITENALTLNSALMGMEKQFDRITEAKARYDAAMEGPEKDDEFTSYAEAFEKLDEQFDAGTTNSNAFWAAAEYLFGSDQLSEWGWSDGIDKIREAMKANIGIFKDADSAGAGFLDRLYKISEEGQVLDDDGNLLANIEKLADGSYKFDIDAENISGIAEELNLTEEAVLACLKALSMWGDVDYYNPDEVLQAVKDMGIGFESLDGTVVNVSALTDQMLSLGKTEKEIHDVITTLREVDGVTLLDTREDVDTLKDSLIDLGIATNDEVGVKVNTEGFATLLQNMSYTKDEAEEFIKKLDEADGIELTDAQGNVMKLSDALEYINTLDFAEVQGEVDALGNAIDGSAEPEKTEAEQQIEGITSAADVANTKVEELQTTINGLTGKEITIAVDLERKNSILDRIFGSFAKGTGGAPGGDALVGEEGPELIKSGDSAYLAGVGNPEIVDLNKGDTVYTAEETKQILSSKRFHGVVPAYNGGARGTISTSTTEYTSLLDAAEATKDLEEALEDTLDEMKEAIDDIVGDLEHSILLLEHGNADSSEIIRMYRAMQEAVHEQAEAYRKLGLDENSDYIQDLQAQWWEYQDTIQDLIVSTYDKVVKEHENAITLNENWLNNAIEASDYDGIVRYTSEMVDRYRSMQDEIHRQAEYYRSLGYSDTSDEVSQLSDLWWDYYEEIKNVSANAWQQVVDNANEALDTISGLYDTLKDAALEYAENGYLTVDMLQEICSYGIEYLAYLEDENGQLVINEERIQSIIAARTEQMAIESALSYVQQLRQAVIDGNTVALLRLTTATDVAAGSTWDLVYAQLQLLGLESDQYSNALQRINTLRSLTDITVSGIGKIDQAAKKVIEEQSDALEDLLEYVKDMIKQEVENQVEALEKQVEAYREIVDLQKKSLELEREKDEYTKSVKEKQEEIAELRKQIYMLDLDDSRSASAQKTELQKQLTEKINELADYQADHAYDVTSDMLDDMADAYEDEKDKEIALLKDTISSEEKLYQLAIKRISNQWDTLYQDLINWNYQYGSVTSDEITSAWNTASSAVQQYGGYLNAVLATQKQLAAYEASSSYGSSDYSSSLGDVGEYDTSGGNVIAEVKRIVAQMKSNSVKYNSSDANGKTNLSNENSNLASQLSALIGRTIVRGNDGVWYLDKIGGQQLYSTYPYSTYHTGGIAGDEPDLKQKELFAKLERDEAILTEKQQDVSYRALEYSETMIGKLGSLFKVLTGSDLLSAKIDDQIKKDSNQIQSAITENNNITIAPQLSFQFTEGMKSESDARKLGRIAGNTAISTISDAFAKKGKTPALRTLMP